jgi:hypothetical protein
MNDPIAQTETKPVANMELPLSMKLIGWYHTIFVPIYVVLISWFMGALAGGFTFGKRSNFLGMYVESDFYLKFFLVVGVLLALMAALIGFGLLKKNKISWFLVLIINVLGLSSVVPLVTNSIENLKYIPALIVNALIVWKLVEHRRLFGI